MYFPSPMRCRGVGAFKKTINGQLDFYFDLRTVRSALFCTFTYIKVNRGRPKLHNGVLLVFCLHIVFFGLIIFFFLQCRLRFNMHLYPLTMLFEHPGSDLLLFPG